MERIDHCSQSFLPLLVLLLLIETLELLFLIKQKSKKDFCYVVEDKTLQRSDEKGEEPLK